MAAGGKIVHVWAEGKKVLFRGNADDKERVLCTTTNTERADDIAEAFQRNSFKRVIRRARVEREARREKN